MLENIATGTNVVLNNVDKTRTINEIRLQHGFYEAMMEKIQADKAEMDCLVPSKPKKVDSSIVRRYIQK